MRSRTGRPGGSPEEKGFATVLLKDRLDAATTHTPRQRDYDFPGDFPQRLNRFQREPGLPWTELHRRLGTSALNLRRWKDKGVRPILRHQMALLELAEDLGLGYIFTDRTVRDEKRCEPPAPGVAPLGRSPGRKTAPRRGG